MIHNNLKNNAAYEIKDFYIFYLSIIFFNSDKKDFPCILEKRYFIIKINDI
ncbi:hypothetical protein ANASTE_00102 [Anaerofustis stercorihominis DSM 17244]|uniref:Uncharacterized protein n=1 Tax=Anaerofustis stercorihominis DSM 17244 TaxID=445971 RepID=B1C5W4_9FIRM|nr:hypothetical protein ANASTE_00102 [Anaerofustis stercorihominis DSM 17244]